MTTPAALSAQNPWPDLRAFTEDDRDFFFGRERETAELLGIVKRASIVVLYGQSGLGKTSLLQAGLFPELKKLDYLPFRLRFDHQENAPSFAMQLKQALVAALQAAHIDVVAPAPDETLWEYLHRRDLDFWGPRNRLYTPVIVLDQFEEIFTLGQASDISADRVAQFAFDLESVIEHRPPNAVRQRLEAHPESALAYNFQRLPVKFVLSLREDFLPQLDPWRSRMPSLLPHRLRLERMTATQALSVIERAGQELVDPAVAREIVEFVSSSQRLQAERSMERRDVEPALLSVFCTELNRRRIARGQQRITSDLLTEERAGIIQGFYERAFERVDPHVREWVEDELLTSSGYRDRAAQDDALRAGLSKADFDSLVNAHLLFRETRDGVQWLELTHDLLTQPASASREAREQRLREEAAAARDAEQREKLRHIRMVSAIMALLFLFSVCFAVYAFLQKRIADKNLQAANVAKQQAQVSEAAANESQRKTEELSKQAEISFSNELREKQNELRSEQAKQAMAQALAHQTQQLAQSRKDTLDRAKKGLDKAREAGGKAYAATKKAGNDESREAYLGAIDVADDYAATILTLDPQNEAATTMQAYDGWFRADTLKQLNRKDEARKATEATARLADQLSTSNNSYLRTIAARTYISVALLKVSEDHAGAEAALDKGLSIANRESEGNPQPENEYDFWHTLAIVHSGAGEVEYDLQRWDLAITEYNQEAVLDRKSYEIARAHKSAETAVSSAHNDLIARHEVARIYLRKKKDYQSAQTILQDELSAARKAVEWVHGKNNGYELKFLNDEWEIEDTLGELFAARRKTWPQAVTTYQSALNTGEKILAISRDSFPFNRQQNETEELAKLRVLMGNYPAALAEYRRNVSEVEGQPSTDLALHLLNVEWAHRLLAIFEESHGRKADALTDRQKELQALSQAGNTLVVKLRTIAVLLGLADDESALQNAQDAAKHYAEAAARSEDLVKSILLQPNVEKSYDQQNNLSTLYQRWAFAILGSGDREGARPYLEKSLQAARTSYEIARAQDASKSSEASRETVRNAASSLGWMELLNNHYSESLQASEAALTGAADPLVNTNIAHAYLFLGLFDRAKQVYLDNRGEEVNLDTFEFSVRDDYALFRKLGMTRPDMAEIEKLLGIRED